MSHPRPRRRRFRQLSAVVLGLLVAAGVGVLALGTWSSASDIGWGLVVLAIVPAVLAVLVWPSVELAAEGVWLRNVGVDTLVPWHLVDDCETRWNLRVWTEKKPYTAWAISSSRRGSMPEHHIAMAGLNPMNMGRPGRVDAAAAAAAERHAAKVHAASVADAVEGAKKEYDQAVSAGALAPTTGDVRRVVSPVSAGLLGLAALLLAVGLVLVAL